MTEQELITPKDRETEREKTKQRNKKRFGAAENI